MRTAIRLWCSRSEAWVSRLISRLRDMTSSVIPALSNCWMIRPPSRIPLHGVVICMAGISSPEQHVVQHVSTTHRWPLDREVHLEQPLQPLEMSPAIALAREVPATQVEDGVQVRFDELLSTEDGRWGWGEIGVVERHSAGPFKAHRSSARHLQLVYNQAKLTRKHCQHVACWCTLRIAVDQRDHRPPAAGWPVAIREFRIP